MTDEPREYDREYKTRTETTVCRRLGYSHDHGEVTQFVVQLEYLYEGQWTPVVRYDHDPSSLHGHDVTDEGLHIDVYRDGEIPARVRCATDASGLGARLRRRPFD